jgi:hypothetical protein
VTVSGAACSAGNSSYQAVWGSATQSGPFCRLLVPWHYPTAKTLL